MATLIEVLGVLMVAAALTFLLSWAWALLVVGLGTVAYGIVFDAAGEPT